MIANICFCFKEQELLSASKECISKTSVLKDITIPENERSLEAPDTNALTQNPKSTNEEMKNQINLARNEVTESKISSEVVQSEIIVNCTDKNSLNDAENLSEKRNNQREQD